MTTKILDPLEVRELQPAYTLWEMYHPEAAPYRFKADNPKEAEEWQRETRAALNQLVGFQDFPEVPLDPQPIEQVDKGDYWREKVLLRTTGRTLMPVYLLIPKGTESLPPVVIAFHGHGYGVKDIVGLWEDGGERETPEGYQNDFAVGLCRKGFAVAAPEISCFGERQTDFSYINTKIGSPVPTTCDHTSRLAQYLGGSALGLRIWDAKRLVNYLESRTDIDATRLGAMGISGGGMHTLFSTCLDTRIKACAISGYFSTFQDSILAVDHCSCNFVPGLWRFGEMHDLTGLVAPRPFFVEAGTYDPLFPIEAVKKSIEKTRAVYAVFGESRQVELDLFEGRHSINGRGAYDFLMEKLSI